MQYKKGQAAMEFLMTYGWAILAAIIAIGVLAYFGVFNPGRLAGPAGLISPPFNLDDFNIVNAPIAADTDNVTMIVTQNLGSSITLLVTSAGGLAADGFTFKLPTGAYCPITEAIAGQLNVIDATTPVAWTSGTQIQIAAKCPSGTWSAGDAVRGDVGIKYTKTGSALTQTSQGNVRGPSQ